MWLSGWYGNFLFLFSTIVCYILLIIKVKLTAFYRISQIGFLLLLLDLVLNTYSLSHAVLWPYCCLSTCVGSFRYFSVEILSLAFYCVIVFCHSTYIFLYLSLCVHSWFWILTMHGPMFCSYCLYMSLSVLVMVIVLCHLVSNILLSWY